MTAPSPQQKKGPGRTPGRGPGRGQAEPATAMPAPLGVEEATAGAPVPLDSPSFLRDTVAGRREGSPVWLGPDLVTVEETTTIPYLLQRRIQRSARRALIEVKSGMGDTWTALSASQFYDQVQDVAAGLIGMGLEFGDAVAIMSRTRYEWTLLDYACWYAGLVPVPIYETSSLEQARFILSDADVKLAVAETMTMSELVRAAGSDRPGLRVLSLDQEAIHTIKDAAVGITRAQVGARTDRLRASDVATIVYTSGTTGRPKGTVISHGNFAEGIVNALRWMPEVNASPNSRFLLFLPLAHVFARFIEVFQLSGEGVLGHVSDTKNLLPDLHAFRPTFVFVVPRVLEKVYNSADAQQGAGFKQKMFRWAANVAVQYSKAQDTAEGPSAALRAQHAVADRLVFSKIRALVGGNLEFFICGGAPLSERLARFYTGLGLTVLEGYGLTETVGPISVSTPSLNKIGTVGSLLPKASAVVSDDGEILVKGPMVFQRYHNDPDATSAAFTEDGWFRTGDLGSVDEDGYIHVTGRLKELIVTAGGKNVSPAAVEDDLTSHPLISQIVVVGDKRPFIAALVTLDAEMLPVWLRNHGLPQMSVAEAASNIEVLNSLQRAIDRANKHVSRAESIRKFTVLTTDFTEANGLLTPSLKVKRGAVLARYKDVIDDIYGGPVPEAGH
ncbi:AMP-dependent synthetase/ligase [Schaalia naturae]|uniref:Acyl-CoA synthetase n=1 Tax=Schaalia naturae TaxID=635203 RepID=A0ABW2SJS7_9ACTO